MVDVAKNYRPPPVPTRDAATVALLRDGESGLEVYLMRRQRSMKFAAGMYVFPGGGVHASDLDPIPWAGPTPAEWAERFHCSEKLAGALVVAAARELFEETGVLLACRDGSALLDTASFADLGGARVAVESGDLTFAEFLRSRGLTLRSDLLGAWAHWITPEFEPRRYDTRFFVAELPAGHFVGGLSGEADGGAWMSVAAALESAAAGQLAMMPPTRHTCRSLMGHSAAGAVAAGQHRPIETIKPRLVVHEGGYFLNSPTLDEIA
ncbi:NUDIX hydrolase [Phytohabitans suffuscus]|uniref:NUDIX hydrolase n=1 Tax=Phytohabitans suffuscus TaxID=624315 RepID=A0A6F8YR72_9ACTN|nr:NUDIX domain-containing protein [Phytohabitans suffuscus]BCB88559.1 NUDIX hydrolase [Phytohabitans suffuscus]